MEKCVEYKPRDIYYKNLGDAYYCVGILEKAVKNYDAALGLNPTMDEAEYNLATAMLMLNQMREAKRHVTRAIKIKPDNEDYQQLSQ